MPGVSGGITAVRFDEEALTGITSRYKVDTVVTHTFPSFCELIIKDGFMGWATRDDAK
jgi:hypothetical protein